MTMPRADENEKRAVALAWEVVESYWIELRRVGWTCRTVELYASGSHEDGTYHSYVSVDIDGAEPRDKGLFSTVYTAGTLVAQYSHLRWALAEHFAGILRNPCGGLAGSMERSESAVDFGTILDLTPHSSPAARQALLEESALGDRREWHRWRATLLAADMILDEVAGYCIDPETLEVNRDGRRAWTALLALPVVGMPAVYAERAPESQGRGQSVPGEPEQTQ